MVAPAENPKEMSFLSKEPRRPNLATIVGSGLAVVAAGSLLAFSSLAEQAGLQGLAAGGLQPAQPARAGRAHPITVPAPAPTTAPPRDPRDALAELVRDAVVRAEATRPVPATPEPRTFTPRPAQPQEAKAKKEPRRIESRARVAVPDEKSKPGEPPYGHAWGHHKAHGEKPKPAKHAGKAKPSQSQKPGKPKKAKKPKKHESKASSSHQPVYARSKGNGGKDEHHAKPPKPQKTKKVAKGPSHGNGHGKAKGHAKANGNGHSKGKGKGHSKHGH